VEGRFFQWSPNDPRKVNKRKESIEVPEYHNSGGSKPIMCNVISGCKVNSTQIREETSYLTMGKDKRPQKLDVGTMISGEAQVI